MCQLNRDSVYKDDIGLVWYLIVWIPDLCTLTYFYNVTHRMVDSNLTLLENGATLLRDKGDVRFYLSAGAL